MHSRCEKAKAELARESQSEIEILREQIKAKHAAMLTNLQTQHRAQLAEEQLRLETSGTQHQQSLELQKREVKLQYQTKLQKRKLEL